MTDKKSPHVLSIKYVHYETSFVPFVSASGHEASASSVALENENTVSKAKKDDLLYMCNQLIIPRDYHIFYKSLALERKSILDASETQQHEQEASTANKKKDRSSLAAKTLRNRSAVTGCRRTATKTKKRL